MTLAAAQQFIQRAVKEPDLVRRINAAQDKTAVHQILDELNLHFEEEEFEPAYFNVLTWCQTHEQAAAVQEVKQWWEYLRHFLSASGTDEADLDATKQ